MAIKIINDVFDNSEMRGNDRLVMLAIADNADEEKRQAWPSVANIAHKTRIPIRTVWRCIKRCVASGELAIIRSGSKDGGSNLYEVLVKRSSRLGSVKMTGAPIDGTPPMPVDGIPPMPMSGTLTVIEPSLQPSVHTHPSLEECKDFCTKLDLPERDGEWFFYKCQGNGWTNNGKAIKDWKATIRAWKEAGYMASQKAIKVVSTSSVFNLKSVIQAKEKIMSDLESRHRVQVATGFKWNSELARARHRQLREEVEKLNEQLSLSL